MKSFDERSRESIHDFARMKKDFAHTQKWNTVFFIISLAIGFGLVGFIIWVIVMIMRFFGVI